MKIAIDLDNTLLRTMGKDYRDSQPINKAIEIVRDLYSKGHFITIFTARGQSSRKDWTLLTKTQLDKFRIPYNELIVGNKPSYDLIIDDKALNAEDWIEDPNLIKNLNHLQKKRDYNVTTCR